MSTLPPDKPPDRLQEGKGVINNGEKLHGEGKSEKEGMMGMRKDQRKEENTSKEENPPGVDLPVQADFKPTQL
ncbi:Hypothetical protein FKW44_015946 [Caligus rogercresseyi]|uniref:Uncharacterized protein n=1 Tax=Caligus rogercresseyi TaxID=217165 RepID=A0A7T8H111_CALRO|nr:Hypothetical protein FKW44_015946 [Caligus rogercresseyi]